MKRLKVYKGLKIKAIPVTGLNKPRGFLEFEAPRFLDSRHMNMVSLSALRTSYLYAPRKYVCY